jgi:uncharacterized damage-inducible protein DinB
MSRDIAERYRRWFEYEQDAHARVVRSLETVPADRRTAPEFHKAVALLAHITAARRMWLQRLGVAPGTAGPLFPENVVLAEVAAELQAVQKHWADYLSRITDEELNRTFEYQSLDGGRFRNRVEDILAQLFGHSSYHRGQIAMLVRAAGGEPAVTDLIYWCREPVGGTTSTP